MLVPIFSPDPNRRLTEAELYALPVNWMTAACMDSGFRRLTGWQGLVPTASFARAFTCRIKSYPGVFGLMPTGAKPGPRGVADFRLFYFPTIDDPVIEQVSLAAAVEAVQPDAAEKIRNFPAHPDFAAAFAIGEMQLVLTQPDRAFGLSLTALTRRRIKAPEGIAAPEGGWLVPPGGLEEDLPTFDLSRELFCVLAAGFAAATKTIPVSETALTAKGNIWIRQSAGRLKAEEASDIARRTEVLLWSEAVRDFWPEAQKPLEPEQYRLVRVAAGVESPNEEEALTLKRPKLVVLSGFLGSGKTTFLNQFIEYHLAHDQLVAVIQNEVGETGVDANLLEGEESVLALDAGCVCCSLAGSLGKGLRQLNETLSPEIIILETTGLANPMNMIDEFHEIDDLAGLASVVAVIDAARFHEALAASDVAAEQIRAADIIVLNKCDLVDKAQQAVIEAEIAARNPQALLVTSVQGRVNPSVFAEGLSRHAKTKNETPCGCCGHGHHHHHGHACGVTHLHEGFSALRFDLAREIDHDALIRILEKSPPQVLRVKGLVRFAGEDRPQVVQYVPGQSGCEPAQRQTSAEPFVLVIGRDLDSAAIEAIWKPLLRNNQT